ncbi:hypothetical protein P4S72_19615 [Vibrio sp. PP-XX7]
MRRNHPFWLSAAITIAATLIICALFSSWLRPFDPTQIDLTQRFLTPSATHWLGTDHLGRDIFPASLCGASTSLGSVLIALGLILCIGTLIGELAG